MMSTVGAGSAPDTAAAPVLGDAWAPTGAAGLFGATRNLREASMRSAADAHGRSWPIATCCAAVAERR